MPKRERLDVSLSKSRRGVRGPSKNKGSPTREVTDDTWVGSGQTVGDFMASLCEHGNPPRQQKECCGKNGYRRKQ